ncbi:hypothetical protein [Amycolatopsis sp. La24]|uniref:hypothetical protein n=1 Tax=Amycolatopsis sp. La24 TaxID=3028304 RepID=UPI0023B1775A|nr:hypothetical protein [Amycolatopsis sp. La24]
MTEVDLKGLLDAADRHVADELESMPEVEDVGSDLDIASLPVDDARIWYRLREAAAVVFDLKGSTRFGLNQRARSTASIYEAATGNAAMILDEFEADFIAIQGDGGFGLFWGEGRRRRAVCAGITLQTFGADSLSPRLAKKWNTLPETGMKVGIAHSPLLVKRVGIPGDDSHEPVWAGRAVNYAAKCAQQADRGQMLVTGTLWEWISGNDYLAASCDCGTPSTDIWQDATIHKIPEEGVGEGEREGKVLTSKWCVEHGAEYCAAVLSGKYSRPNVTSLVRAATAIEYKSAVREGARIAREAARNKDSFAAARERRMRDQRAFRAGKRNFG